MRNLALLLLLFFCGNSLSQITSGTLIYEINYQSKKDGGFPDPTSMQGAKFQIAFNERFMGFYPQTISGGQIVTILDHKNNLELRLHIDQGDSTATYIYIKPEEKSEDETLIEYEELKNSIFDTIVREFPNDREIQGYMCKRTVLEITGGTIITFWSTDQIKNVGDLNFAYSKCKDAIMELTMETSETNFSLKIVSVTPEISAEKKLSLIPPKGYIFSVPYFSLTGFPGYSEQTLSSELIDYPAYAAGWDELNKQLTQIQRDLSAHKNQEGDWYYTDLLSITIEIAPNGTVQSIIVDSDEGNELYVDEVKKLLSKPKVWLPAKIEGVSVASRLEIIFQ